jgi:hypothetical protein
MIEGLHADVPGEELKELLSGRYKYHSDKVKTYEAQLVQLEQFDKTMENLAASMSKTSNATPADSVRQAVKTHRNQAIYYKFMAEHVVVTETYRLESSELVSLGISHY